MKITLTNNTTLGDIKRQFSAYFPFLKLEFYQVLLKGNTGPETVAFLSDDTNLAELGINAGYSQFIFHSSTSIAFFKKGLQSCYNLPVQVFRKAGEGWLQYTQSNDSSLKEENTKAKKHAAVGKYSM